MTSQTLGFILDQPLQKEVQKNEYSENEKSFLDEIKIIFHNYLSAIIW